jgi:hypothetical protein
MLLLSMFLVSTAGALQDQRPDFGGDGAFSYAPPDGWKVSEFPGLNYKISLGVPSQGFAPNIVVVDESADVPLDEYVKRNIPTLETTFSGLKILGQSDFSTSDGDRAVKLITERDDEQSKTRLRQTYYFFDAGNKKLVVTCSSVASEGDALDQNFDGAMKTFRVKPHAE